MHFIVQLGNNNFDSELCPHQRAMMQRNIGSSNIPTKQNIPLGNVQPTLTLKFNSGPIENLPKQFVSAMRTLFDLMDDKRTGFVRLSDIEQRWQDDGAKGLPHGVIECLSKVTPLNGMLSFERFCAGLKICLLRNQNDSNKMRQSMINKNDCNSSDKKLQRPPSAPLLDLENSFSASTQWNSNNTAAVRPNNAIPVQRTLSLPKLCPEKDGDNITPEPYIIPSFAPPKPPRTALVMGNGVTNINNLDRFDKAEIRHALQNWQMGILMNEMDNKDKKHTVTQLNRGAADGQPQNNLFQKKTNVRRREPRRHTLQNGIDYNLLKKLKQLEQEKVTKILTELHSLLKSAF